MRCNNYYGGQPGGGQWWMYCLVRVAGRCCHVWKQPLKYLQQDLTILTMEYLSQAFSVPGNPLPTSGEPYLNMARNSLQFHHPQPSPETKRGYSLPSGGN